MENRIKAPRIVTIGVLTVITVVFWIGFEVARIFTDKPSPNIPNDVLAPLAPTLDSQTLNEIQERVYLKND